MKAITLLQLLRTNIMRGDDIMLEDLTVTFHKEGFIEVQAKQVLTGYWSIYSDEISKKKLELIEDKYKELYTSGFFRRITRVIMKNGWYKYKKRVPFKLYSNNLSMVNTTE